MSILASVKEWFQPVESGYVYDETQTGHPHPSAEHQPREGRVVNVEAPPKTERLTIYTPVNFEDVQFPAADIKAGVTAIVNFHRLKAQDADRISFFLQGVVMALNGEFTSIAEQTMVFAPRHVGIEQRQDGKRRGGASPLYGGHEASSSFGPR